jgi:hypothetical protein
MCWERAASLSPHSCATLLLFHSAESGQQVLSPHSCTTLLLFHSAESGQRVLSPHSCACTLSVLPAVAVPCFSVGWMLSPGTNCNCWLVFLFFYSSNAHTRSTLPPSPWNNKTQWALTRNRVCYTLSCCPLKVNSNDPPKPPFVKLYQGQFTVANSVCCTFLAGQKLALFSPCCLTAKGKFYYL